MKLDISLIRNVTYFRSASGNGQLALESITLQGAFIWTLPIHWVRFCLSPLCQFTWPQSERNWTSCRICCTTGQIS